MNDRLIHYGPPSDSHKLPDNAQWSDPFEIKSSSSDRVYIVARNKASGAWGCSCPSYRTRRTCKHLEALRLPTPTKLLPGPRHLASSSGSKNFMDGYKKYDSSKDGYGGLRDWSDAFKFRMGINEARRAVGSDSPRGILGVSASSTFAEIKKAYRALVRIHHPDVGGDAAMFRKIQGAFEVLESQFA